METDEKPGKNLCEANSRASFPQGKKYNRLVVLQPLKQKCARYQNITRFVVKHSIYIE